MRSPASFHRSAPLAALCAAACAAPAYASDSALGASVQAFAGLGIVIAIIVGAMFMLKRLTPGRFSNGGLLKPVATLAVGPRERIVVVELGDTWIVAGVTAQQISVLHTAPRGEVPGEAAPTGQSFAATLKRALPGAGQG